MFRDALGLRPRFDKDGRPLGSTDVQWRNAKRMQRCRTQDAVVGKGSRATSCVVPMMPMVRRREERPRRTGRVVAVLVALKFRASRWGHCGSHKHEVR